MVDEVKNAQVYTDFAGFSELRRSAKNNDPETLNKVAKQFESVFIQMVMKSMRAANKVFSEDNIMNSHDVEFYQDMFDQQLSVNLGEGKGLGLADVLIRQLSPDVKKQKLPELTKQTEPTTPSPVSSTVPHLVTLPKFEKDIKTAVVPELKPSVKDIKAPIYETPVAFVKAIWPSAVATAKKLGVDPKMLVAQAALETGWGKSIIQSHGGESTHNLFNVKASKSKESNHVTIPTIEYNNGVAERRFEHFKKYNSVDESFTDYFNTLTQSDRYTKALDTAHNAKDYIHSLQEGGYATDPNYANKVYKIYQGDVLSSALNKLR